MSMKEYELLREKYTQNKDYNYYNKNNYNNNEYNNNKVNEEQNEPIIKKSHTFDKKDDIKNN